MLKRKPFQSSKNEDDPSGLQVIAISVVLLGVLIAIMVFLKPDNMSCEEFRKMESIDPRFPNAVASPIIINPCDSINNK
ncbi:hypothetical protein [Sphingobacterium sp. UBA5670]|uniref:hypothetical protein n=1 Tax=Sphingobacterium sp. UBA5670 TaxID=1947502 RepID=UPI0025F83D8E|nr:hypothetical protein [Sphingobacterium sp. UBA5670]